MVLDIRHDWKREIERCLLTSPSNRKKSMLQLPRNIWLLAPSLVKCQTLCHSILIAMHRFLPGAAEPNVKIIDPTYRFQWFMPPYQKATAELISPWLSSTLILQVLSAKLFFQQFFPQVARVSLLTVEIENETSQEKFREENESSVGKIESREWEWESQGKNEIEIENETLNWHEWGSD